MPLPLRPVVVLARPSDEALCWTSPHADSEDDMTIPGENEQKGCLKDQHFKLELCHRLSSWLGWASCAFASWEVICRTIISKQKDLVRHLNETLFEAAECQIAKVQPICINGCLGQLSEAATDIFSPGYLQRGSETVKSHGGSRFLSEFQCQAVSASKTVKGQLEEFLRDAQERGNVYIVLLDQRFFCEQTDAVRPLQWRSKTVLLRIEMQMQTRMAVQLDLSMPTLLDNLEVRGINLAGEEIARVCLNKQDAFGLLRDGFAKTVGQHTGKLSMVLPDGTFASPDMDCKTMTEVFS